MAQKNEFLRRDPKNKGRKLFFDLANLIIPVLIIFIGIFLASQKFAEMMNYDPRFCDVPIYILRHKFLIWPKGYPIFNPFVTTLTMMTNPLNKAVQDATGQAVVPGTICALLAIFTWALISIVRVYFLNKKKNLYGTARWATVKDLKKFGLCEEHGVVLAQRFEADSEAIVNKAGNFALKMKKTAPLVCHSGTSHTLMIAPTRSGKGVGSIVPTCTSYRESMIIFDPKGELYNMTAGYRKKFSRVIKFSPVQFETARFNPLEEVELNENAFRDIGTILTNIFQKSEKGGDSNSDFFDNNARDLLTGVIFHVLSAVEEVGKDENGNPIFEPIYGAEDKTIAGILRIFARAAAGEKQEGSDEPPPAGEELLDEMIASKHIDKDGKVSDHIHGIVLDVAMSAKQQHGKVRSDIMQTVQSKLNLFRDPFIKNVTSASDFKLQDFYDSKEPISLYLTLPFGDIDRIMPIFQLIIDFILRRFSSGEVRAGEKEKKLRHPILFLLDEFPTLGNMKFLETSMGILAGYGLRFFIVIQNYQQLVKIYGQNNSFISHCRYKIIYAPDVEQDAEMFSKMIGKESVVNDNISVSGSRMAVALNNVNLSNQEIARDLINPDELAKLPYTDAIIIISNAPPYMAKKCAYYDDPRFDWKVFFENQETGEVKTGFPAPYKQEEINMETAGLPSQANREKKQGEGAEKAAEREKRKAEKEKAEEEKPKFNPVNFIMSYATDDEGVGIEEWDAPYTGEDEGEEPPPKVKNFEPDDFDTDGDD